MSMAFEPTNYIEQTNHWASLRDYVISSNNLSSDNRPDDVARDFIKKRAESTLLDKKEFNTFDRKIRDYMNNNGFLFKKDNLYRLLFTLKIDNIDEALKFCRSVLHQNELSTHSLDDFIVLCCLKLHISYMEYLNYNKKYLSKIKNMKPAADRLQYGITGDFIDKAIHQINSLADLTEFIDRHIDDFAKTRNTPYLYLYDHITWEAWTKSQWLPFFDEYPDDAPEGYESFTDDDWFYYATDDFGISNELMQKLILYCSADEVDINTPEMFEKKYNRMEEYRSKMSKKAIGIELKDYYLRMFSLCDNGLTERQIRILSNKNSPYSDAFMTYENYVKMYSRKRSNEISQGVYLISFIHKYDLDKGDYRYGDDWNTNDILSDYACDLFNPKLDIDKQFKFIDEIMAVAGFPSLSSNIPFNKLFMDTYREVLSSSPKLEPENVKTIFISELCSRLKLIAEHLSATIELD